MTNGISCLSDIIASLDAIRDAILGVGPNAYQSFSPTYFKNGAAQDVTSAPAVWKPVSQGAGGDTIHVLVRAVINEDTPEPFPFQMRNLPAVPNRYGATRILIGHALNAFWTGTEFLFETWSVQWDGVNVTLWGINSGTAFGTDEVLLAGNVIQYNLLYIAVED